jgi:hypothetical protein
MLGRLTCLKGDEESEGAAVGGVVLAAMGIGIV